MNNKYFKISFVNIIVILIISVVFSYSLGNLVYKIPKYEKIEIFISSSYIDEDYLSSKMKIDSVKEINIIPRSINNNYYEESLQTIGIYSDLLIIPEKYLNNKEKAFSFSSINKSYFEECNLDLSSFELIVYENNIYGIVIYDKNKNINLFKDKIVFENDDRYILCIGKNTPNVVNTPTSKKETNNAYKVFIELIK